MNNYFTFIFIYFFANSFLFSAYQSGNWEADIGYNRSTDDFENYADDGTEGYWEGRYGEWKYYYENGQLEKEGDYEDGESNGLWIYYHENGNVAMEVTYNYDIENGQFKGYSRHFRDVIFKIQNRGVIFENFLQA